MGPGITRALLLVVALSGCSSATVDAGTMAEYAEAMQAVEIRHGESPNPGAVDDDREAYPLGGDMVGALELFSAMEDRLAGWSAIQPPEEAAPLHNNLTAAFTALQDEVSDYLYDQAMSNPDFTFRSIGVVVRPLIIQTTQTCRELSNFLAEQGTPVAFFDDCAF